MTLMTAKNTDCGTRNQLICQSFLNVLLFFLFSIQNSSFLTRVQSNIKQPTVICLVTKVERCLHARFPNDCCRFLSSRVQFYPELFTWLACGYQQQCIYILPCSVFTSCQKSVAILNTKWLAYTGKGSSPVSALEGFSSIDNCIYFRWMSLHTHLQKHRVFENLRAPQCNTTQSHTSNLWLVTNQLHSFPQTDAGLTCLDLEQNSKFKDRNCHS